MIDELQRMRLWKSFYEQSKRLYSDLHDYYDRDASLTADAAVRGLQSPPRGLSRMPICGEMVVLGAIVHIDLASPTGRIDTISFGAASRTRLLWCESLRAVFVFPYMRPGVCNLPPTKTGDRVLRRWAKGRPATCSEIGEVPNYALPHAQVALAIEYRSDKFSWFRREEHFIHHFEAGVACYSSQPFRGTTPPRAIMVRGGKLRLETHGLDG